MARETSYDEARTVEWINVHKADNGSDSSQNEDVPVMDDVQLLRRVAASGYPLVENASISLLILHPEMANAVLPAIQQSEQDVHLIQQEEAHHRQIPETVEQELRTLSLPEYQ